MWVSDGNLAIHLKCSSQYQDHLRSVTVQNDNEKKDPLPLLVNFYCQLLYENVKLEQFVVIH